MSDPAEPSPAGETHETFGLGASSRASRYGPGLSLLGAALWLATIASYVLLKPPPAMRGAAFDRDFATKFLIAFVVAGVGVCVSWTVSALGLFLSLSERRHRPGPRANRGTVLGWLGVGAVAIVVFEIFRIALTTTE
jgi:hypothetical protein